MKAKHQRLVLALVAPAAAPALAALGLVKDDDFIAMARQDLHHILRHAPPLPGTAISSLAAWREHLACAATHAPALLPAGGTAHASSSSARSCGAKMKRTTD